MPSSDLLKDQQKKDEDLKAGVVGSGEGSTTTDEKNEPKEEKKYTDADVNALLDKKFAEMSAKLEKKYSEQLKAEKDKLTEAQKLEKMNDEEKSKYNTQKLQERIDELEREKNLSEQMTVARKTLKDANITISDELLAAFVTPDAEATKKAVDSFKSMWTQELNAAVQNELKRTPPKADPKTTPKSKSSGTLRAEKANEKYATKNPYEQE